VLRKLAHLKAPQMPQKPRDDVQGHIDTERAAKDALGRLVALYASGEISEDEWTTGRAKANERLDAARKRLSRARKSLDAPTAASYEGLRGVTAEVWRALTTDEQHSVLRLLIDYVEVNPRIRPPQVKRVRIFWR
jgi:ElaB/YqjD/DUF883 family membrane-anchored ribosome-binding protein